MEGEVEYCSCMKFEPYEDGDECICGHVLDEHGEDGVCYVEIG